MEIKTIDFIHEIERTDGYKKPNVGKYNIQPYCVALFSGARGSGKTTICINLIKKMFPTNGLIGIISPTSQSMNNVELFNLLHTMHSEPIHYLPENENVLDFIEKMKAHESKCKEEQEYYNAILRNDEEVLEYHNYRKVNMLLLKPILHHLIIDDCAFSKILARNSPLSHLVIKNRHHRCNIYICNQNFKLFAKPLRQNLSDLFLFKTQDPKVLDEVFDEIGNLLTKEQWYEMFQTFVKEDHDFLWISMDKKKHWPSRFRLNLNDFILLPNNK